MNLWSRLIAAGPVLVGVAVAAAAAAAQAQPRVTVKDAAARVVVIAERRADVQVEIDRPNARLPLTVRRLGDRVEVDGDLRENRVQNCRGGDGPGDLLNPPRGAEVEIRGVGRVPLAELPLVIIRTPLEAKVDAGGAVWGSVSRTNALELGSLGCGDWTVANVAGPMTIRLAGSGDVRTGTSGSATVRLAGSGDVEVGPVRGPIDVEIAGSGDVDVASAQGAARLSVAGSGDIEVAGGQVEEVRIRVAGSGDVTFNGSARTANIDLAGSGSAEVARVSGQVNRRVIGSGGVRVNGRDLGRREDVGL